MAAEKPIRVFLIYCKQSAIVAQIASKITGAVSGNDRIVFTQDEADRVLVLLTANVLTPPTLQMLEAVIKQDKKAEHGRLAFLYDEASWAFNCAEKKASSDAVQSTLENHEILTYRPKSEGGAATATAAEAASSDAAPPPGEAEPEAESQTVQAQMAADPSFTLPPEARRRLRR